MGEQDSIKVACHIPEGAEQLLYTPLIPTAVQQEHQVVHLQVRQGVLWQGILGAPP